MSSHRYAGYSQDAMYPLVSIGMIYLHNIECPVLLILSALFDHSFMALFAELLRCLRRATILTLLYYWRGIRNTRDVPTQSLPILYSVCTE